MVFTDTRIEASLLKKKLQALDKEFREHYLNRDWSGCLIAIKKQNRLLGLCPIESESEENTQEDYEEAVALLTTIRIVSPNAYKLVIKSLLS